MQKWFTEEHSWFKDRDCIGLGPSYGEAGDFMQSDIQFAQQTRDMMRRLAFSHTEKNGVLPDSANMNLFAHIFVLQ